MAYVEEATDVDQDITTVYDQWTQFESFPRFMEGVKKVTQLDDAHIHWVAEVGGRTKEWDAEITQQIPDDRISWSSTGGATNGGTVTFAPLGPDQTRVTLRMEYQPEDWLERAGEALGIVQRQVRQDLRNFKEFIEDRDEATGEWRGRVA